MRIASSKRLFAMALVVAGGYLFAAGSARAQQAGPCQPWINQDEWTGTISFQGDGQVVRSDGSTVKVHESATVSFATDNPPVGCFEPDPINWIAGTAGIKSVSVNINDEVDTPCQAGGQSVHTEKVTNGTFAENVDLVIDPFAKTYQASLTQAVDGLQFDTTGCDGTKSPPLVVSQWGYGPKKPYLISGIPLPTSGVLLSGNISYQAPAVIENFTDPSITWTVTWNFVPTPKNLDLVITISNYQTWRPAGGKTEKEVGTDPVSGVSVLELDAQFIDKDTGAPSIAPPEKITFSLVSVSHEPGVSMNWPEKKSATKDADMEFDAAHNPLATLGANGSKADFTPLSSAPVAAFVSPHDWGGWATLNVTATFNGKTYQGHLKGAPNTTNILLPKRQADSHIADVWKTKHNVPLGTPDTDDAEADPVSYPGCVGDGLSAYEEYRGFMENSKHIEGDISAKDFFIENLIGGNAKPGIAKFTELTGLIVHKDIQESEMQGDTAAGLGDRLINFNYDQGAHVTDQHGVFIVTCRDVDGGQTFLKPQSGKGFHGRPGLTEFICMQGRNSIGTLNADDTHRGSISPSDAATQYDLGVAHELSHSVGVEHHGETDDGSHRFTLLGPDDPRNTKHIPAFFLDGAIVSLLDEVTLTDRAVVMWETLTEILIKNCGSVTALYGPAAFSKGCETVVNHGLRQFTDLTFYIGHPQAQHSGDDQCVMRYFFANVYPSKSDSSIYYISQSGTEPKGNGLCISPAGTGINSSSHKPQSRYSDARAGRGACQNWVCVNDKYPPIPD